MRYRRGQVDVTKPLATDLGAGYLYTAPVADDAFITDPLILAAVTFPVPRGSENAFTKEPVSFGFERAVVDSLRLFDLAAGPGSDLFGGS
jgi:hypothetical protein